MLQMIAAEPLKIRIEPAFRRHTAYTCILIALAAGVFFTDLGGPAMNVDEAQYALCVENARQTHQWLCLTPYPPEPYFQKPPMYMWLTGLTYRFFGEGMARYRFWSAIFGIGCVALTCVLGAMLLSAEAGLLGGLLLLTNRYFQDDHGARAGSLDTAVTFCVLACLGLYWGMRQRRVGPWAWACIGAMAGWACLFKPIAGIPVLGILAVHALLIDERESRVSHPVRGSLWAALACGVIVSPYYLLVVERQGGRIFHESIKRAIIDTATVGDPNSHEHMFRDAGGDPYVAPHFAGDPWWFLVFDLHRSSVPFTAAGVAVIFAVIMAFRRQSRAAYGLLALASVTYFFVFSFSIERRIRYTYPAFPAVALSIAGLYLTLLTGVAKRIGQNFQATLPTAGVVVLIGVLLVLEALRFGQNQLSGAERCDFVPWNIYQTLKPGLRNGRIRLIAYGFPATQFQWRKELALDAADCFYLHQMQEAVWINDPSQLDRLLAAPMPTLLLVSSLADAAEIERKFHFDDRSDNRFTFEHRAFRMHGIDMTPLLSPKLAPDDPTPYIQVLNLDGRPALAAPALAQDGPRTFTVDNEFVVRVVPPLREDAWVTISLVATKQIANEPIRFDALLGNRLLGWDRATPHSGQFQITFPVKRGRWAEGRNDIVIHLMPIQPTAKVGPLSVGVSEVSLSMYPAPTLPR